MKTTLGQFFSSALLSVVVVATGCNGQLPIENEDESAHVEETPTTVELDSRRTTRPDIALRNFEARIESLRQRRRLSPQDFSVRESLVEHLLASATFLGRYEDFDEADRRSAETAATFSDDPRAVSLRASFLSSVHRFGEARVLLDHADSLGADEMQIERSRIGIDLATGVNPEPLLARARALVQTSERYANLTTLAGVLAASGRYEEADDAYLRALNVYRDVSPFTLAWVSFARGVMWGEMANRADLAKFLYRDAVARLPFYVVANTHLAELEPPAQARERLSRFVEAGDPEPSARLAGLSGSDPMRANALRHSSDTAYQSLLSAHRAAFLDHAAEFYFSAGDDTELALSLSLENLSTRPNARAFVLAIQAAHYAQDTETLCQLIDQSTPIRARHRVLDSLVEAHEGSCS